MKTILSIAAVAIGVTGCQWAPGPQAALLMREERLAMERERTSGKQLVAMCEAGNADACAYILRITQ